jgi:hypothetical protein
VICFSPLAAFGSWAVVRVKVPIAAKATKAAIDVCRNMDGVS